MFEIEHEIVNVTDYVQLFQYVDLDMVVHRLDLLEDVFQGI